MLNYPTIDFHRHQLNSFRYFCRSRQTIEPNLLAAKKREKKTVKIDPEDTCIKLHCAIHRAQCTSSSCKLIIIIISIITVPMHFLILS